MYDLWCLYILPGQFIHFMAHSQWPFFPMNGEWNILSSDIPLPLCISQLACPITPTHPHHTRLKFYDRDKLNH